jgi:hypothetical protein
MADDIPGSEFHVLRGCGHSPVAEMPEVTLRLVTEFLNRQEVSIGSDSEEKFEAFGNRFPDEGVSLIGWDGEE